MCVRADGAETAVSEICACEGGRLHKHGTQIFTTHDMYRLYSNNMRDKPSPLLLLHQRKMGRRIGSMVSHREAVIL